MIDLTFIRRSVEPDADGTHAEPADAWLVLATTPGGEEQRRAFSDSASGGTLRALVDAVRWRDRVTGSRSELEWIDESLERVARGGTFGWWVAVETNGILDADFFEDHDHGGMTGSLGAALRWRGVRAPSKARRKGRRGRRGGGADSGAPRRQGGRGGSR